MTRSIGRAVSILGGLAVVSVLLVASNPSDVRYAYRGQFHPSVGSALAELRARIGSAAPELAFRFVGDDSLHHLSEFRGKVVLLCVWTTSCGPCRAEMPALNSLQKRHGVTGWRDHARIRSRERIRRSSEKSGLVLPPLSAYSEHEMGTQPAWPLTIVIDAAGTIRAVTLGQQSEGSSTTRFVDISRVPNTVAISACSATQGSCATALRGDSARFQLARVLLSTGS